MTLPYQPTNFIGLHNTTPTLYSVMGFPYIQNNFSNSVPMLNYNECHRKSTYNPKQQQYLNKTYSNNAMWDSQSQNQDTTQQQQQQQQQRKRKIFGLERITEDKIEEFESFLKNKAVNTVEFLCTQRGAKETEKLLKKSPNECITILIKDLNTSLSKVMTDIYGNYFCQKIIQNASQTQITLILHYITHNFIDIAKDYSGTHVLQALLDVISTQEQMYLILYSIENKVLEMAYDNNATHVLQKVIQIITEDKRSTINESIINDFKNLSLSPQGICVIKKYIATNTISKNKNRIIKLIIDNCLELSQDPFGNYTIQSILEEWGYKDCNEIINIVIKNFIKLSKQKFSSNVVEKIVEISDDKQRKEIYDIIVNSGEIEELVKNKYGKFVFQKCVKKCSFRQREVLISLFDKINYTSLNSNNSNNKGSNNKIQNEEVVQV